MTHKQFALVQAAKWQAARRADRWWLNVAMVGWHLGVAYLMWLALTGGTP